MEDLFYFVGFCVGILIRVLVTIGCVIIFIAACVRVVEILLRILS